MNSANLEQIRSFFPDSVQGATKIEDFGVKIEKLEDKVLNYTILWNRDEGDIPADQIMKLQEEINIPFLAKIGGSRTDLRKHKILNDGDPMNMVLVELLQIVLLFSYLIYCISISRVSASS